MRARGRGMTWWARTAQKSGSRLLPNAAVPVWLSSALRTSAMAPEKKLETGAPWQDHRIPDPCGKTTIRSEGATAQKTTSLLGSPLAR